MRETVRESLTDTFNCKYEAAGVLLVLIDHIIGRVSIFLLFCIALEKSDGNGKIGNKSPRLIHKKKFLRSLEVVLDFCETE